MKMFRCACSIDGTTRCAIHREWLCHDPAFVDWSIKGAECPPCFLARVRSVSLSAKATPTRGKRP